MPSRGLALLLGLSLLCLSTGALALPNCYLRAEQHPNQNGKHLVPSDQWVRMSPAQRKAAGAVWIVSAVNSTTCRVGEVLPGGVRVDTQPLGVPFGFLYEILASAVAKKNVQEIEYINDHTTPANKSVDALLAMYSLPPPSSAGGWASFSKISQIFQLQLSSSDWLNYGLLALFKKMGGQGVKDCRNHHFPAPHTTPGMKFSAYRRVLSAFGLQVGTDSGRAGSSNLTFQLQGCIQ